MGVLHDLSKPDMHQILSRGGLAKIMEAAVYEPPRRDRSLIVTGLEMFERETDGTLAGRSEPLFWAELPEFGHLQTYQSESSGDKVKGEGGQGSLRERVVAAGKEEALSMVEEAFIAFLSRSLGFAADAFDSKRELAMYGVDSLSGVSCQYWLHKGELPRRLMLWVKLTLW